MNQLLNASLPQTFGAVPLSLPGVNMSPLPVGNVVLGPVGAMPVTLPISGMPIQPFALGTVPVQPVLDLPRLPMQRRRRQQNSPAAQNTSGQPQQAPPAQNSAAQQNPPGLAPGSFPIVPQLALPGILPQGLPGILQQGLQGLLQPGFPLVPRPLLPQTGFPLVPPPSLPMLPPQGFPVLPQQPHAVPSLPYFGADGNSRNSWRCYGRSTRASEFSPEEDERLAAICETYEGRKLSMKEWQAIATKHGAGYTAYQCRIRWHNFLKPPLSRSPITPEERKELFRASLIHNNNWSHIASLKCAGKIRSPFIIRHVCCAQKQRFKETDLRITTPEQVDKLPLSVFAEETTFNSEEEEESSSC